MGLKTVIFSSMLGGVVLASAGVMWAGGDSVDGAIDLIKNQDTQLENFKGNEAKLVAQLRKTTSTIQGLQTTIAAKNQEIADLIAAGGEHTKIVSDLQAEVARLTEELVAKTAELKKLQDEMAAGNTIVEENADLIQAEIDRLVGEINEANEAAALLQAEVDRAGDVPTSNTTDVNSAIAEAEAAINNAPVDASGGEDKGGDDDIIVSEYQDLKMIAYTPVTLNSAVELNKKKLDSVNYDLVLTNLTNDSIKFMLDGNEKTLGGRSELSIGAATDLNGKKLDIVINGTTLKYNLINE